MKNPIAITDIKHANPVSFLFFAIKKSVFTKIPTTSRICIRALSSITIQPLNKEL